MLYILLALGKKETRIIYITSSPLDHSILDYYVSLLPKEHQHSARQRVLFISVCDTDSNYSLSEKLCHHPRLLKHLKTLVHPKVTVLNVLRGMTPEIEIAKTLGIPIYSAKPSDQIYGSKPGSRMLFQKLQIPCPDGMYQECYQLKELITQILAVVLRNPTAQNGVVKLTDGFSGKGNALMDLTTIQKLRTLESTSESQLLRQATLEALETMDFCSHGRTWDDFLSEINSMGAIFEVFVEGDNVTSPSVQVVVNEDLTVSILSTHEQVLDGQVYVGCRFPAAESYRRQLMQHGRQVGEFFASKGITDHFSVDFVCIQNPKSNFWDIYAIEINLRITGTTHPWMTLKLLTHGSTDTKSGLFLSNSHKEKYYIASDNITSSNLKHLVPMDVKDIFEAKSELHWCPIRQTGVVFHLLGCVSENGKIGMTSIGDSPQQAQKQFDLAVDYLLKESETA